MIHLKAGNGIEFMYKIIKYFVFDLLSLFLQIRKYQADQYHRYLVRNSQSKIAKSFSVNNTYQIQNNENSTSRKQFH